MFLLWKKTWFLLTFLETFCSFGHSDNIFKQQMLSYVFTLKGHFKFDKIKNKHSLEILCRFRYLFGFSNDPKKTFHLLNMPRSNWILCTHKLIWIRKKNTHIWLQIFLPFRNLCRSEAFLHGNQSYWHVCFSFKRFWMKRNRLSFVNGICLMKDKTSSFFLE